MTVMEKPKAHNPALRLFFFWSGIIATLAYRLIIVLNQYSPEWVKISWYVGTIGFIIYFIHRYQISKKRVQMIKGQKLVEKMENQETLNDDDRNTIVYVLRTLRSSKEKWNYIWIFVLSIIALLIGLYYDFFV